MKIKTSIADLRKIAKEADALAEKYHLPKKRKFNKTK